MPEFSRGLAFVKRLIAHDRHHAHLAVAAVHVAVGLTPYVLFTAARTGELLLAVGAGLQSPDAWKAWHLSID
jgi:hypothetical protein